jgi:hypothetical protein
MTDTTKPNRDRPSDREAAENPCGPATGPPEGTASSGSTSPPLDIAKLRAAAAELGYWPATTDDEHLEKLRADNERFDRMNTHDPYHSPCPVCGRPTASSSGPHAVRVIMEKRVTRNERRARLDR